MSVSRPLQLLHTEAPKIRPPQFGVDGKLHEKLDDYELSSTINRSHCCACVGRAGSGKTSMMISFLTSKNLFRRVFSQILVCMPPTSRQSLKKDPFKGLPPNQIFDSLTVDTMQKMLDMAAEEAKKEGGATLMIFDDVQVALKDKNVERLVVHANNNRRHNRTTLWFMVQNWVKMPRSLRMGCTNVFLFSVSRADQHMIYEEVVEIAEPVFNRMCLMLKHEQQKPDKEKSFLFIDVRSQRYFLNWSEIRVPDELQAGDPSDEEKSQ
jgi:hypothetical protein